MHFLAILALVGLVIQPTCGHQYFVKILPAKEGEVYQMQVGEVATFKLATFEKTEEGELPARVEIDKTLWNFDKHLLEKVYSDNYSIQLRAVKAGTATIDVTAFMQNFHDIKSLTILITK